MGDNHAFSGSQGNAPDSTKQRTALIAFGMVFAILLANALISYLNIRRLRTTDDLVRHTNEVLTELNAVFVTVLNAETGQRGYLITNEELFLEPYTSGVAQVEERLHSLAELVADNAVQSDNVRELSNLLHRRFELLRNALAARRGSDTFEPKAHLLNGKNGMDRVRSKIAEMEVLERTLLVKRQNESTRVYFTAVIAGTISTMLGLLLAIAGYILVLRDIEQRNQVAAEMQAAHDRLEDRVRERTETITSVIADLHDEVEVRRSAELEAEMVSLELQRSNSELEQFASVASHDLQEPLRKIQAFADRLQTHAQEQLGERGQNYLERIVYAAGRMRRLIDDLLAYSRVTSKGKQFAVVDLNHVLEEVLIDLEGRLHEADGQVLYPIFPMVAADPFQMRQLFQNLIANALKFHRPGVPPQVDITTKIAGKYGAGEDSSERDLRLQITVSDNGVGFEPTYKDRIFELFQRLHGKDEYEGTGIGLAICKKIVERHGGTIVADGVPGKGASFTFSLPLAQTE